MKIFPERVVLELTPMCNLSCFMCPRHYIEDTEGFMDEALYKKLVDEVAIENPQAIILPFWRGESCMHPKFKDMLRYTLEKGMRVHLSTNGHFLDDEFMNIFFKCEFVTFSLHDNRGYKNAKKFLKAKPSWSSVTIQVSFVDVERSTQKFLQECTSEQGLNGFDSVRLYAEHTIEGEFGKSGLESDAERIFCPKLEDSLVVSADGQISRCNHIWEMETVGDLVNSTIKEVWHGERINEIRCEYPDVKCSPCDQWAGHTKGEAWRKTEDGKVNHVVYSNISSLCETPKADASFFIYMSDFQNLKSCLNH
ncbi:MAG: radical SAM protein [Candidatus Sedimenticola sp. 6PFRAG1]